MKLNEFYTAVDGNYEDAMERLQNEMFVVKFLRMLPRDGSMMLLEPTGGPTMPSGPYTP